MHYEQKRISCSENLRIAGDRYSDSQVDCGTQMANATCDVWSNMMGCYVTGLNKGLGGVMKAYIAGVQCFCDALETVSEELYGKKCYITLPQDPGDKEVRDAKADFYKTLNKIFDPLFQKLETEAEIVGDKYGKSTQAKLYRNYQNWLEDEGQKQLNLLFGGFPEQLDTLIENTVADKEAKEKEAKSSQILSQQLEDMKKELKKIQNELAALKNSKGIS